MAQEKKLRAALATGALMDLRTGQADNDDPARSNRWEQSRTIRAETLIDLVTAPNPVEEAGRPRALRLAGARITGRLNLQAAELTCPVTFRACWFEQPVILAEATGLSLRLPGCHLPAMNAQQLTLRGDLQPNYGFTAYGEVNLRGAHIGGTLNFIRASLTNPDGLALTADGLRVDQSMFCGEGFTAQGEVNLLGAHIGGQLDFSEASLTNPNGAALRLQEAEAGALILRYMPAAPGLVELTHAHVRVLLDDPASWPQELHLRGFTYDALYEQSAVKARDRLRWLRRDPRGYSPQPYEQLAAVYQRSGREEDARQVAIAKQQARRGELAWPAKLWSLLLGGLVGHGYRTWFAGLWLMGWLAVGTLLCATAHPEQFRPAKPPPEVVPAFQPAIYAMDVLLPVVNLNQETAWLPTGWVRWWLWASILAGWVLTTAVVAALTGLLKRD